MASPPAFSPTVDRVQRDALLDQAAKLLDDRWSLLGDADRRVTNTEEGQSARDFKKDIAELGAFPDVLPVDTDAPDFLQKQLTIPFSSQSLLKENRFYWIRFPVGLSPRQGWAFNRLDMWIEFTSNAEAHARPKVHRIFPDAKFQTLLKGQVQMQLYLDENLELQVKSGNIQQQVGTGEAKVDASAGGKVAGGIGFAAGPFVHELKVAKISHEGLNMEWAHWRLDGPEFFQENTPDLFVVAQVPKGTTVVGIKAHLQARRYFSFLAASVQKAVENFPEGLKAFFKDGLPLEDSKTYDLTPVL